MTENDFWDLIENAWSEVPELKEKRLEIATIDNFPKYPNELEWELKQAINEKVYPYLELQLRKLSKDQLFEFNRILERKLFIIDRWDIHYYTGGSDDGFLYARGFIVGMGKTYWENIDKNPKKATSGLESEYFAYMSRALYHNLFDDQFLHFEVDRETGSNHEGWENEVNQNSFDEEFCLKLEIQLCNFFKNINNEDIKGFWCDGIVFDPIDPKLAKKNINGTRRILTTAWIGKDGQDQYEMTLYLGKYALRRYARGMEMVDCIPIVETLNWVDIDILNQKIKISLR